MLLKMRTTISLLIITIWILTGCASKTGKYFEGSENSFTFAYLTDIHVQPEQHAADGFQKAVDTINLISPDFVLTGGDLVMDVLDQTYGRSDSLFGLYKEISDGFSMPVFNTVGNHEVYGWHREEAGIEAHPEYGKRMYEKHLGDRYYSFDHKGWHFIVLDVIALGDNNHYIGKVDTEQIDWLKSDLQEVNAKTPIALSVHIPFITSATQLTKGSMAPNSESGVITNSLEVLSLFLKHNLRLVLQGHLHFLEDIFIQNRVHFITGGAVSGHWWANRPGAVLQEGFLLLHLKGEVVDWEYVDFGWKTPFEE